MKNDSKFEALNRWALDQRKRNPYIREPLRVCSIDSGKPSDHKAEDFENAADFRNSLKENK